LNLPITYPSRRRHAAPRRRWPAFVLPSPVAAARGVAEKSPGGTTAAFPRLGFRAAAAASAPTLSADNAADDGGGGAGGPILGPFGIGREHLDLLSGICLIILGSFRSTRAHATPVPGLAVVVTFFIGGGRLVVAGLVDLDPSSSPSCESGRHSCQ
jgi:hypothetical protein